MSRRLFIALALLSVVWPLGAADLQPPTLALGAAAPDFKLPGVDSRDHALKDFAQAKVLVVVFTAVHCPTAQYYEARTKQLGHSPLNWFPGFCI